MKIFHYFRATTDLIANTTDILLIILHIPNYSCINAKFISAMMLELKYYFCTDRIRHASRRTANQSGAFTFTPPDFYDPIMQFRGMWLCLK